MIIFCFKYIKKYSVQFIIYLIIILLVGLISVITPIISSSIINSVIYDKNFERFFFLCLIFSFLFIVELLLNCLKMVYLSKLQIKTVGKITSDIIKHLHRVKYKLLMDKDYASLTQKINNDAVNIMSFMLNNVGNIMIYFFALIVIFFMLCKVSILLSLLLFFNGCIYLFIYKKSKKQLYCKEHKNKEAQSKYFSLTYLQFQSLKYIKEHNLYNFFELRLEIGLKSLYSSNQKLINYKNFVNIIQGIADIVILILCYLCVGNKIIYGDMKIGLFALVTSYISMSKTAIVYFGNLGQNYQSQKVSYSRLKSLMDLPKESNGKEIISTIEKIEIKNLTFAYQNDIIINNFNADFIKGNIYGIKGENGAGKSTLIDIIIGLYNDSYKGNIWFNGKDIR